MRRQRQRAEAGASEPPNALIDRLDDDARESARGRIGRQRGELEQRRRVVRAGAAFPRVCISRRRDREVGVVLDSM